MSSTSSLLAAAAIMAITTSVTAAPIPPPVASERHARCGFNKQMAAAQVGIQEVNSEIILTEPPMRDMRSLSCYDVIRGQFSRLDVSDSIPSFILNLISSYSCDRISNSLGAVRDRYRDFATTPYGQALAASGAELPVSATPPSFLSQPEPAAPTVSSPVFGTAPSESPDRPQSSPNPGLPQGGGPNIY